MSIAKDIADKCYELGISVKQLCEKAGVHQSVMSRWLQNEPKSHKIAKKLQETLKEIEDGKI